MAAFDASRADKYFPKGAVEKFSNVLKLSLSKGGIIIAARNIVCDCVSAIYISIAIYCGITIYCNIGIYCNILSIY